MNRDAMIIEAARQVRDGDIVVVGSGLPLVVAACAQRSHASRASFVLDSGAIEPAFDPVPVSVSDPDMAQAVRMATTREVLGCLVQGGRVGLGLIGAAQVDACGNINSSYLGSPAMPVKRFPGSGGASAIARNVERLVVVVKHEARRFPRRCDYVSSAPFGPPPHERIGVPGARCRELVVVTDLCVLRMQAGAQLEVTRLMPGVSPRAVIDHTPFLERIETNEVVRAPSRTELAALQAVLEQWDRAGQTPARACS